MIKKDMMSKNKVNSKNIRNEVLKTLGKRIRSLRKKRALEKGTKFSQEELGKLSGLHRNYISDVERGRRNVSWVALVSIICALDCNMQVFFGEGFENIDLFFFLGNKSEKIDISESVDL